MENNDKPHPEETLDPDDWNALRKLGHRMVDDMMDYLSTVRRRTVWKQMPDSIKEHFNQPLPENPAGEETAYEEFVENILPYPMGNIHPRFWAWVVGTGTPLGMLSEMLAAGMNPNLGGADHGANYVESQVVNWCKQMVGFPSAASGLLVSGCSMANLVGLTVARNAMAGNDIRTEGLGVSKKQMLVYGSTEMHSSIQKAAELLGLGSNAVRRIPVNADFRIDMDALARQLAEDKASGAQPFCIVANAGTVNTGAYDDMAAIATLCREEGLWLHVDGAFGALAAASPSLRPLTKGMVLADSLAFDLHKWMYMPLEIACVLVKNEAAHLKAFSMTANYLEHGGGRGLMAGDKWFSDYGVQLSRGFRALKAWMTLKAYGMNKHVRLIEQNVEQARYLAELVDRHPDMERVAPAPLNIVCFRYTGNIREPPVLNALNRELLVKLHESGIAAPSYSTLNGKYVLRVAITNHRSRREDFDLLVREVARLGKDLSEDMTCLPESEQEATAVCWFGSPNSETPA